ncbi:MAG: hypothetical protein J6X70_04330 [Muribaculaceae bacterium]|nr:hypothetical protein [Muribaculaceae bacterium]
MLTPDTLENYERTHQIEWADELPEGCPPSEILIPDSDEFYRFILDAEQISEDDFKSYLELYPDKNYQGNRAVKASGLSVYDTYPDETTRNLPGLRKFKGVAKLILSSNDGVLMKSGHDEHHYTWWRSKSFDISTATMIKDENA